ncbi:hypothetical protein SESBI_04120 [Sesbania bispinosa]|nr:hypothetical protein SESBI_04120 [Sesbania bispinosa]
MTTNMFRRLRAPPHRTSPVAAFPIRAPPHRTSPFADSPVRAPPRSARSILCLFSYVADSVDHLAFVTSFTIARSLVVSVTGYAMVMVVPLLAGGATISVTCFKSKP